MSTGLIKRRFSVAEYYCMGEAGILPPDERTELIEGEVFVMPPIGPGHAEGNSRVDRVFQRRFYDRAVVRSQNPIRLPNDSEPQPDIVLARLRPEGYGAAHPQPEDIFLVVEISNTTLASDRDVKLPLYARAGIVETWLMNLPDDRIEVYRDPAPEGYRSITLVPRDGAVTPLAFPDVTIPCAELLP
ncbi:MAG: Uma2 family endonuclease [Dehalococcoidia bacterium]